MKTTETNPRMQESCETPEAVAESLAHEKADFEAMDDQSS